LPPPFCAIFNSMENTIKNRIASCDWNSISAQLSLSGFALTGPLLSASECDELVSLYSDESMFRSRGSRS
jgi:hypothetical protein